MGIADPYLQQDCSEGWIERFQIVSQLYHNRLELVLCMGRYSNVAHVGLGHFKATFTAQYGVHAEAEALTPPIFGQFG